MWGYCDDDDVRRGWGQEQRANPRLTTGYDPRSADRCGAMPSQAQQRWADQTDSRDARHGDSWTRPAAAAISIKTRLYSMKSTGGRSLQSDGDTQAYMWSVHKQDDVTIVRDVSRDTSPVDYRRSRSQATPAHGMSPPIHRQQYSPPPATHHMPQAFVPPPASLNQQAVSRQEREAHYSPPGLTYHELALRCTGGSVKGTTPSGLEITRSPSHPCDPETQPLLSSGEVTPHDPLFLDNGSTASYRPSSPLEFFKLMNFMGPGKHVHPKLMSKIAQVYEEYYDEEEGHAGVARNRPLPYKRCWSIPGVLVFIFFLLATAWYFYVRVTYTLDSGYLWYARTILALELFTALSTFNYAFLLTRTTATMGSPGLPAASKRHPMPTMLTGQPALTMTEQFHVRVLIPCYRETCELVMMTVRAAATALLPQHTKLTVYLCDDGRDPMKQKAVQSLPNVEYISGRERVKGEVNGKSNNLNYALNIIYSVEDPIPESEIVVVFDADMVPKYDFFLKVLEVMTQHNVALCLTPQAYHNVNAGADIFNNSNLSFWEYLLPGLDAWGYIACTGTNFAIRARALADCGWFPSWTITEDYALGMKLKEKGYNGVYLKEYLAEGEAPQEIRNIFRQRSRWCKGQFQVLFSRTCPLFSSQLSMGMRLLYTGVTFSYITNFVAILTALLVPFVALVFGYYPLVINRRFSIACTAYLASSLMINMFSYRLSHLRALWFASSSCVLLWFTWAKAMLSVPLALMRIKSKAAFKATSKAGESKQDKRGCGSYLRPPNVGNLEGTKDPYILLLMLLIALSTVGVGVYGLAVQPYTDQDGFRWYLLISVLWAGYFSITPALFIFYCFNKGKIFEDVCSFAMYACTIITAASLYCVWQVPEDYSFQSVLNLGLQFYNAQRSGALPLHNDVPWRGDSALFDSVMLQGQNYSLSGGWYDGGDHMKYTYSVATSVSMLSWAFIHFNQAFQGSSKTRALEVLKWGTDYLVKCHIPPSGLLQDHQFVAQVGNVSDDRSTWIPAEALSKVRPVFLLNRTHPGSDLMGSAAAAMAAASVAFENQARQYPEQLLEEAKTVYQLAVSYKGYYSKSIPTGGMYPSSSMYDDLALAACWLYRATRDSSYLQDCKTWRQEYLKEVGQAGIPTAFDYQNSFWAVEWLLYGLTGNSTYQAQMKLFVSLWATDKGKALPAGGVRQTKKGLAWLKPAPLQSSNNAAFLALLIAKAEKMPSVALKYGCWAHRQVSYVLGDSGRSYMVGYGNKWPVKVPHRGASCPATYLQAKGQKCGWDSGYYTSSPNPNMLWGAVVGGPDQNDVFYDERDENSLPNQVSILNNAGFVGAVAGLTAQHISVSKCEQGHGFVFDTIASVKGAL